MITRYQANLVLNQWFNASALSIPPLYYIGLSTTTPTFSMSGVCGATEPSGLGYTARPSISSGGGFTTSTLNTLGNVAAITFPESSGSWGTITHVCIFDSATPNAGNLLYFEALSTARLVATLTTVNFPIGQFTITLSN